MDWHHVEPVVKVLSELSGRDLVLKSLVRGRDDAHVDRDGLGTTDTCDDVILKHTQHLGLSGETHVADFVEE